MLGAVWCLAPINFSWHRAPSTEHRAPNFPMLSYMTHRLKTPDMYLSWTDSLMNGSFTISPYSGKSAIFELYRVEYCQFHQAIYVDGYLVILGEYQSEPGLAPLLIQGAPATQNEQPIGILTLEDSEQTQVAFVLVRDPEGGFNYAIQRSQYGSVRCYGLVEWNGSVYISGSEIGVSGEINATVARLDHRTCQWISRSTVPGYQLVADLVVYNNKLYGNAITWIYQCDEDQCDYDCCSTNYRVIQFDNETILASRTLSTKPCSSYLAATTTNIYYIVAKHRVTEIWIGSDLTLLDKVPYYAHDVQIHDNQLELLCDSNGTWVRLIISHTGTISTVPLESKDLFYYPPAPQPESVAQQPLPTGTYGRSVRVKVTLGGGS